MVLLGYGLEPTTIGRFTMIENTSFNEDDESEEDLGIDREDPDSWGAFE